MKVRGDRPSYGSCVWTAPDPPNLIMRNMRDFRRFCRLEYLKFTPDVRGLLVCCNNSGIQGIHACTELYQPPRRVVDFTERGLESNLIFWTYFPINSGETIENAWNYQHQGQCMSSSLTVSCRELCPPDWLYTDYCIVSHISREDCPFRT